jgi:Serine carboxypeptidase
MGPYVTNDDGKTLRQNPYAWNKFSSVVYIEAPAGVGEQIHTTISPSFESLSNSLC